MPALDKQVTQRALLATSVVGTAAIVAGGRGLHPVLFVVLVAGTFGAYAALVAALSRAPKLGVRLLAGAALFLMVFAVAMPARSSKDVWAYVMYGRIVAVHHASPYTHVPADYPSDPALQRVQVAFRDTGSVYGPAFTAVSAAGMAGCGSSPICGRVFFQTLEALAVLAAAWIVLHATGSRAAAACVAFNPVLIASVVNGAHNDGLVALGILAAVLLAREQPFAAGLLLGAAALIKVNALLPAGVLVVWLFVRASRRTALQTGATTAVLTVGGYLLVGGARALRALQHNAIFVSHHSFWFRVQTAVARALTGNGRTPAQASADAAHIVSRAGLIVVVVLACAAAVWRISHQGAVPVVAAALVVYVLASPYILPWYTAPLVPLLSLRWRSKTTWVMLGYAALLFTVYPTRLPPHPSLSARILPWGARTLMPIVELVLLAGFFIVTVRPRRSEKHPVLSS